MLTHCTYGTHSQRITSAAIWGGVFAYLASADLL